MGGNGLESKYKTIIKIPEEYRPKTVFAPKYSDFSAIQKAIKETAIEFPIIAKPDIGFRGLLVKKLYSEAELESYLQKYPVDFIIQEFVSFSKEFGVLYYRLPQEAKGHITSITLKEFLHHWHP